MKGDMKKSVYVDYDEEAKMYYIRVVHSYKIERPQERLGKKINKPDWRQINKIVKVMQEFWNVQQYLADIYKSKEKCTGEE